MIVFATFLGPRYEIIALGIIQCFQIYHLLIHVTLYYILVCTNEGFKFKGQVAVYLFWCWMSTLSIATLQQWDFINNFKMVCHFLLKSRLY